MRRVAAAFLALLIVGAPAYAQGRSKGTKQGDNSQQTEDKKKKEAEAEKAYKDALRSIPEQKLTDPWAKMR
jgi:hypothetical protein